MGKLTRAILAAAMLLPVTACEREEGRYVYTGPEGSICEVRRWGHCNKYWRWTALEAADDHG
jgi:hypothetical protein